MDAALADSLALFRELIQNIDDATQTATAMRRTQLQV
jgi:hypothetical protein